VFWYGGRGPFYILPFHCPKEQKGKAHAFSLVKRKIPAFIVAALFCFPANIIIF